MVVSAARTGKVGMMGWLSMDWFCWKNTCAFVQITVYIYTYVHSNPMDRKHIKYKVKSKTS